MNIEKNDTSIAHLKWLIGYNLLILGISFGTWST